MGKFRKKTMPEDATFIEAVQFLPNEIPKMLEFCDPISKGRNIISCGYTDFPDGRRETYGELSLPLQKNSTKALYGDWIIKDTDNMFSICKPDVFISIYEEVGA